MSRGSTAQDLVLLGQIAGPLCGQSRLNQAVMDGTSYAVKHIEFHGHRRTFGLVQLIWQVLKCVWWISLRNVGAVYIASSRTPFGMLRDLALLLPFIVAGIPIVSHIHGAEFEPFYLKDRRFAGIKAFYLRRVTTFIFVSDVFMPQAAHIAYKSISLNNPVPQFVTQALGQDNRADPREDRRLCFGFISTFARQKGIELFLDAAAHFSSQADFIVAGGPAQGEEAFGQAMIDRMTGLQGVEYLGYLPSPKAFYDRCDVMIFPTQYASEAASLIIIEALATRTLPIVRRHNRLCEVYAGAPIMWFQTPAELHQAIQAQLAEDKTIRSRLYDEGAAWAARCAPSQAQWAAQVDAIIMKAMSQNLVPETEQAHPETGEGL